MLPLACTLVYETFIDESYSNPGNCVDVVSELKMKKPCKRIGLKRGI